MPGELAKVFLPQSWTKRIQHIGCEIRTRVLQQQLDLPGGSTPAMMASLRDKILTLADETVVLPGHGPATTIGRERRTNPYLREISA